jgi:DNA-directed RNA polymerase subunit M/transcription elongation factor TFIIS
MNRICDRCGSLLLPRPSRPSRGACPECESVQRMLEHAPNSFLCWLDNVIDRRVQKVLAERELP